MIGLQLFRNVDVASLEPRTSRDSRDKVIVPLMKNENLRLKYLNPMGYMRFGRLLEDLDTFSGLSSSSLNYRLRLLMQEIDHAKGMSGGHP